MPDPTTSAAMLPYDPSQVPDYVDMQRKQMVASMLLNAMQRGSQTPPQWDAMRAVPRRGIVQNVAPLVTSLLASKAVPAASQAEAQYFGNYFNPPGGQPQGQPPQGGQQPPPTPPAADSIGSQTVGGMPAAFLRQRAALSANPAQQLGQLTDEQYKAAQRTYAPTIQALHGGALSDDPVRDIKADPTLWAEWQQGAAARGIDPLTSLTSPQGAQLARQVLEERANQYRSAVNLPTVAPPDIYDVRDVNGALVTTSRRGDKPPEVKPPEQATTELKEGFSPRTNSNVAIPVVTKPGFRPGSVASALGGQPSAAAQPPGASVPGTPPGARASVPTSPVNLGPPKPDDANYQSAGSALSMTHALQVVQSLEAQGYTLPSQSRALVLDALTKDGSDGILGIASETLRQKIMKSALDVRNNPQASQYVAGLIPMLQAAAREITQRAGPQQPAQLRSNFEALVPHDVNDRDTMGVIGQQRADILQGLKSRSGAVLQMPGYEELRSSAGGAAQHPPDIQRLLLKYGRRPATAVPGTP